MSNVLLAATSHDRAAYVDDYFRWTVEQADLLRLQPAGRIDWENVAEEIESLGKSVRYALENNAVQILWHLIKWRYQPSCRKGGWEASIVEHRRRVKRILKENPSLARHLREDLQELYAGARNAALVEMKMADDSLVPTDCPFTLDEALEDGWLPK